MLDFSTQELEVCHPLSQQKASLRITLQQDSTLGLLE